MHTFADLQSNYKLPKTEFYKYLRLRSIIVNLSKSKLGIPSDIITQFDTAEQRSKGISLFYHLLNHNIFTNKTQSMETWETDLSCKFTMTQWQFKLLLTFSNCISHWESSLKLLHKWFYTPARLSKMSISITSDC